MINEPIINARFKKFRESFGLAHITDGEAFERYVNSSLLTTHQPEAFSADSELLDKICVGGNEDTGIDGIAIKINGLLLKDVDEISDVIQRSRKATIEFIFIQSKYKPNFDSNELNSFIAGVRNFLSNTPNLPMNSKVKEWLKIKDYLLSDDVIIFWENNPTVRMYYVAMGKWREHQHHLALAETAIADIKSLNIFETVDVHFVDSEYLKIIIDSNENKFTALMETIGIMELTPVNKVENSCIALCKADEFSKLLTTTEGVIRKSLFDDNVRDFQGHNTVNSEILETIQIEPSKFIPLNNGITIVCDDFSSNNRKLKIVNPQIVNGCQTSHVIFIAKQKGYDLSEVPVSVKIISTSYDDIANSIVRGTNRQNIVYEEAFEGTKKFHKELESFFNSYIHDFSDKIYYERRSRQYSHNPTIKQVQKISIRILTQYFVGMFLNKPHVSHHHEFYLIKEFQNIIYQENQSRLPYFTAAYAFYKLEKLFREHNFYPDLIAYKSQMLMAFRESISGKCPSINNEKLIDEHCHKIIEVLKDEHKLHEQFSKVGRVFKNTISLWIEQMGKSKFAIKDVEGFTQLLLLEIKKTFALNQTNVKVEEEFRFQGPVIKIMADRYGKPCGFIKRDTDDIFFHSRQNKNVRFSELNGKVVSYKVVISPVNKLPEAIGVQVIK